MLGYLAAGMFIGPFGIGLVTDLDSIHAFAEFGVVFLLFTIGLELPWERIKVLSPALFALGLAQILITGAAISGIAIALGAPPDAAIVIGAALALSSTVFVIQILLDRRQLATRFGRAAFTVLMMQDLAIAPILVLTLALTKREGGLAESLGFAALEAVAALAIIFVLGRFVLRPLFAVVAAERSDEIFAAATLLVVVGIAGFTDFVGLSLALGGLLAGMVLAETEYRHQVSAEIRPFRALLLGLFFMLIGMQTDLGVAVERVQPVLAVAVGLIVLKAAILAFLVFLFRLPGLYAWPLGLLLAQGGEFAFVIFNVAMDGGLIQDTLGQTLIVAVALSMMATPVLAWASARLAHRAAVRESAGVEEIGEEASGLVDHVVIAGYAGSDARWHANSRTSGSGSSPSTAIPLWWRARGRMEKPFISATPAGPTSSRNCICLWHPPWSWRSATPKPRPGWSERFATCSRKFPFSPAPLTIPTRRSWCGRARRSSCRNSSPPENGLPNK